MNVLLIDDDPIFNLIHKKLLERMGMIEISSALNGAQAIALINDYFVGLRAFPDLVLLDLNMPIMDGFSFLDAMKRIPTSKSHDVKVVVVTSSDDPRDIEKAKSYGVHTYLTKPISEDSLRPFLA